MKVHVRPAREGDIDAIVSLLHIGLGAPFPPDNWRHLFEYPRVQNQPNLGFVLETGNQIVGFLGAIYSERLVEGRVERFCNLSSWCVNPEFRFSSIALLMALLSQPGYTFTNLTPSTGVTQVMQRCRFRPLESHKLMYGAWLYRGLVQTKKAMPQSGRFHKAQRMLEIMIETPFLKGVRLLQRALPPRLDYRGVHLRAGVEFVRPMLSRADQQLLDDHRQCGHFLVGDERSYSYIVTVDRKVSFGRRSLADFVVSDILHFSPREPGLQHWQSLCRLIAGHLGSHAVAADARLFDREPTNGLRIPCYSYFLSKSGINPDQIDSLYSEMTLLDLPIYVV